MGLVGLFWFCIVFCFDIRCLCLMQGRSGPVPWKLNHVIFITLLCPKTCGTLCTLHIFPVGYVNSEVNVHVFVLVKNMPLYAGILLGVLLQVRYTKARC